MKMKKYFPWLILACAAALFTINIHTAIAVAYSGSKETDKKQTENLTVAKGPSRVSAAPNMSIVTGRVLGYCITSSMLLKVKPAVTMYGLKLLIESSEGVGGKGSFTKNRIGEVIQVYTRESLDKTLFGKNIKGRVTYAGDERGGRFSIEDIEILE